MLLEQCAFQIWSWSTFNLQYSSKLLFRAVSQDQNLQKAPYHGQIYDTANDKADAC